MSLSLSPAHLFTPFLGIPSSLLRDPDGRTFTPQCLQAQSHSSFSPPHLTPPPAPSLQGSSKSSAQPTEDSHSPPWGLQQPGTGTNFSLQQTLPPLSEASLSLRAQEELVLCSPPPFLRNLGEEMLEAP